MAQSTEIENAIWVENGVLVWRLRGYRGRSSQASGSQSRKRGHKTRRGRGNSAHWRQAATTKKIEREAWQALLLAALRHNPEVELWRAPVPAQITIRVYGPSLPDSCNVPEHHKYAIDALVALGILVNDSPKYLPWTHSGSLPRPEWLTSKTEPAVEFRLEAA